VRTPSLSDLHKLPDKVDILVFQLHSHVLANKIVFVRQHLLFPKKIKYQKIWTLRTKWHTGSSCSSPQLFRVKTMCVTK
jgi:hypothetical protein